MEKNNFVYYLAYGSNLLRERFEYYIKGGFYHETNKDYKKCVDPTIYFEDEPVRYIVDEFRLFFGNKSLSWDEKGVAFIEEKEGSKVLGRLYKVTQDQFAHIQKTECKKPEWYGRKIHDDVLGEHNGLPIWTITCDSGINKENPASPKYLSVIRKGLEETGYTKEEIEKAYFY